jgi:hypothetical protein
MTLGKIAFALANLFLAQHFRQPSLGENRAFFVEDEGFPGPSSGIFVSKGPSIGCNQLDRTQFRQNNSLMKPMFKLHLVTLFAFATLTALHAADVTGKWKSEFDTQIGHLKYTYELKADGEKLTGKAFRELEGTKTTIEIVEGKVKGDEVSFVEPIKVQEQEVRIEYKGKLSGDEIKFTRKVGDFVTTEIVAKRDKEKTEKEKASSGDSK